ncbi:hypothetical protein H5410_032263 [Solanum commersonii]|uniref:Uncharacterized protein n=1 Tax=Solanum commersonii TaxID=4109 RepID=A0A9J5YLN6_SOLCO|nr:hypothetical protein H5410_032263 [Solanum commersonii]
MNFYFQWDTNTSSLFVMEKGRLYYESLLHSHIWNDLEKLCLSRKHAAKMIQRFCAYLMRIEMDKKN